MKKLMMLVAVIGMSATAAFAQDAKPKVKKHKTEAKTVTKTEVIKPDGKTTKVESKTETATKVKK